MGLLNYPAPVTLPQSRIQSVIRGPTREPSLDLGVFTSGGVGHVSIINLRSFKGRLQAECW